MKSGWDDEQVDAWTNGSMNWGNEYKRKGTGRKKKERIDKCVNEWNTIPGEEKEKDLALNKRANKT